jgi:hypothetical protein
MGCSGVGERKVATGTIRKAFEHSGGTVWRAERRRRLVIAARRTLNWTRVIKWSGASGKTMLWLEGMVDSGTVWGSRGLGDW